MTSMFNVAVVGLGMGQGHLRAYNAIPDVRITAIADIDDGRLRACADQYHVAHAHTDYHELLAMRQIDAVSVCLPNYLHAPVAIEALQAGKHVLVEKPMAPSVAAAEAMIATAAEYARTLAVSMNYRWTCAPETMYLKRLIERGKLGTVYYIRSVSLRRRTFPRDHTSWFTDKKRSGGGGLMDMGPHMLDLAMWLADDFSPVLASGVTYTAIMVETDVDDLASALVHLKGGATIALESTWASFTRPALSVSVFGTRAGAMLDLTAPQGKRLSLYGEDENVLLDVTPVDIRLPVPQEATVQEHFVNSIRAGRQPETAGACGLAAVRVLAGIYESSRTHRDVALTA